jgi:hypothetical protein
MTAVHSVVELGHAGISDGAGRRHDRAGSSHVAADECRDAVGAAGHDAPPDRAIVGAAPAATGIERNYPVTASFIRSQPLMILCTSAGFIDLLDYVPDHPGVPVASLLASSPEAEGVRFISLEWLQRLEAVARRPKDLLDLRNLPPA